MHSSSLHWSELRKITTDGRNTGRDPRLATSDARRESDESAVLWRYCLSRDTGMSLGNVVSRWREIYDGIHHCLSGRDEYRCDNEICVAEQFFVDDQFDSSDEMNF